MTAREHEAQRAMVRLSLLLAPTRAERHGVYPARKPPRVRAWVLPVVQEKKL